MSQAVDELWAVARAMPPVDAIALARAVEDAVMSSDPLDYRTRLLIRDSLRALECHWGHDRFDRWLRNSARFQQLSGIGDSLSPSDDRGFPFLARNIVD